MAAPIDSVPMARGADRPLWPLKDGKTQTSFKSSASFGAPRTSGSSRWHVGIDIPAKRGDVVVAMEDGELVCKGNTCEQGWMGADAKAVLVQNDSGLVVLYGALIPGSYKEFGLGPGSRVKRGQPLGRIGTYPAGTSMLHLETYAKGTKDNAPWYQGKPPPPEVLNPTEYLRLAAEVTEAERAGGTSGQVGGETGTSTTPSRSRWPEVLIGGAIVTSLGMAAVAAVRASREGE